MDKSFTQFRSGILDDYSSDDDNFSLHISTDDDDAILESDRTNISIVKEDNDYEMDKNGNIEVSKIPVGQKDGIKNLTLNERHKKVSTDYNNLAAKEPVKTTIKTRSATSKTTDENSAGNLTDTEIPKLINKIRLKVGRKKKPLKRNVKRIKLEVGKSSIAVPVPASEGNEKVNASRAQINKKKKKTITTPISSNKEVNREEPNEENNGNPKSTTNKKPQRLNIRTNTNDLMHHLSYEQLEEICVRKMCEAIVHESELGELRHQLSVEAEKSKKLTEEVQRLIQQTKDLKILHETVLHKLHAPGTIRPIIPFRVTRSVGLQVGSCNCKKK